MAWCRLLGLIFIVRVLSSAFNHFHFLSSLEQCYKIASSQNCSSGSVLHDYIMNSGKYLERSYICTCNRMSLSNMCVYVCVCACMCVYIKKQSFTDSFCLKYLYQRKFSFHLVLCKKPDCLLFLLNPFIN